MMAKLEREAPGDLEDKVRAPQRGKTNIHGKTRTGSPGAPGGQGTPRTGSRVRGKPRTTTFIDRT